MGKKGSTTTTRPKKTEADKQAAFVRLAEQRMTRTIKSLRSLAKLSGSGYVSTPEQQQKMLQALVREVNAIEAAFKSKGATKSDGFTF